MDCKNSRQLIFCQGIKRLIGAAQVLFTSCGKECCCGKTNADWSQGLVHLPTMNTQRKYRVNDYFSNHINREKDIFSY